MIPATNILKFSDLAKVNELIAGQPIWVQFYRNYDIHGLCAVFAAPFLSYISIFMALPRDPSFRPGA